MGTLSIELPSMLLAFLVILFFLKLPDVAKTRDQLAHWSAIKMTFGNLATGDNLPFLVGGLCNLQIL